MTQRKRPDQRTTADRAGVEETTTDTAMVRPLHQRREEALRLPPVRQLPDLAGRDPWCSERRSGPATFDLDPAGLRSEAVRCWRAGWQVWEVRERFALASQDAA